MKAVVVHFLLYHVCSEVVYAILFCCARVCQSVPERARACQSVLEFGSMFCVKGLIRKIHNCEIHYFPAPRKEGYS